MPHLPTATPLATSRCASGTFKCLDFALCGWSVEMPPGDPRVVQTFVSTHGLPEVTTEAHALEKLPVVVVVSVGHGEWLSQQLILATSSASLGLTPTDRPVDLRLPPTHTFVFEESGTTGRVAIGRPS